MNKILVVTDGRSDLVELLQDSCDVTVAPLDAEDYDVAGHDALCILAGDGDGALNPAAPLQARLCEARESGKPVFCEFLGSIGASRKKKAISTDRQRMVYSSHALALQGLSDGDLLDGQSNECIPYSRLPEGAAPILSYMEDACGHNKIDLDEGKHRDGNWALFMMDECTMISAIRICNFHRARFAPVEKWKNIITSIISFLAGEAVDVAFAPPVCTHEVATFECAKDTDIAVRRGLNWIEASDMLKNGGKGGAYEGYSNKICAKNGVQTKNVNVRADCTGEIGGALLFDHLLTGNEKSGKAADVLFDFNFKWMQVKSGAHKGMIRWSEAAWETCFQDDVARAILPLLLCQHFDKEVPYLDEIKAALDYMISTTGPDGIRTACTETQKTTPERIKQLREGASGVKSAHFNAFYHTVLLLAYNVSGKEEYLDYATRGLATLMSHYPDTYRETSETEEQCRLVMPLAVLYGITKSEEHYGWLMRVVDDLEKHRHPSGGYAEWDTDYKAACSRNHKGECALLASNGDPVADLLYSNNWLPLGFAYAYMVTGEWRFYKLWCQVASFIASAQIHSEDKKLDGAWTRAFDMDAGEICGMPHDAGWGPYCIESGWTVGEILMGLQFMHVAEKAVKNKN